MKPQEKIIDGELCHRPSDNYHWQPYTSAELTRMVLTERIRRKTTARFAEPTDAVAIPRTELKMLHDTILKASAIINQQRDQLVLLLTHY